MDGSTFILGRPKTMDNYDIYKLFGFEQSRSIESSETAEEFNEEDIWGCAVDAEAERAGSSENGCNGVEDCIAGKEGRRKIAKFHEQNNKRRNQSSAPVNIPDWCEMIWQDKKNIRNNSKKRYGVISYNDNSGDDEGGDFERNMIPPHELIAMRLGRSEIASFSEFEGVGKTLKGRDAIWMMTGFID
jgi:hypothetical protein